MEVFPDIGNTDWGFTDDDPEVDVNEIKMGDGYVLRQPNGVNYIRDSWSCSWSSLTKAQAESTYQWLRARKKLTPFLWTHPVSGIQHQVTCQGVSLAYSNVDDYRLQAQFQRDFNPT